MNNALNMNSMNVIARTNDAVYLRIPAELQAVAGDGVCGCPHCKRTGNVAKWDTLVVPTVEQPRHRDYAYTVHMPDAREFLAITAKR